MSISIDDLVASLNSSAHIGQEAVDLAALQKQLSQTIFAQPFPSHDPVYAGNKVLCNTPTMRSPCSSIGSSWSRERDVAFASLPQRGRSSSIASARSYSSYSEKENRTGHDVLRDEEDTMMMDEDDEQMVEELLSHSRSTSQSSPICPTQPAPNATPHIFHSFDSNTPAHTRTPSTFVHGDPFYAAVHAQMHNAHPTPPSFFAQAGLPAHDSTFFVPLERHTHLHQWDTSVTG